MRGTYFLGNGAFETRDIPEHPLAPREVLIQVAACGVCGTTSISTTGTKAPRR